MDRKDAWVIYILIDLKDGSYTHLSVINSSSIKLATRLGSYFSL